MRRGQIACFLMEKKTKPSKAFLEYNKGKIARHLLQSIVYIIQYCLDLRKPDLRKNLDLRKIVATTDFLVHKLFDLRKIF